MNKKTDMQGIQGRKASGLHSHAKRGNEKVLAVVGKFKGTGNQGKKRCKGIFFILLILALLSGCAVKHRTPCEKHGKTYCKTSGIFRSQWDDYYELALSCMQGGCYQEALSALDEALKEAPNEERLKRTYGMHFIDYFPHREKGVIYYLTGQYDKARTELERSVRDEPSDKAFHFLDKVRTLIMQRDNQPVSGPHLTVQFPSKIFGDSGHIWTKDDPVVVTGTAQDKQYVSKITLAGKPVFIEQSRQYTEFKKELRLDQGTHEIGITAENLLGGDIKRKYIIHVDRAGPLIILKQFEPGTGMIQGHAWDESGEISLFANGKPVLVPKGKQVTFSLPTDSNTINILILAKDRLGNQTKAVINKTIISQSRYPPLFAQNILNILTDTGPQPVMISTENQEPEIRLKGWQGGETVFLEKISVQGSVTAKNSIKKLTINNRLVLAENKGHTIFFNEPLTLKQGHNRIQIKATDESGNTVIKEITITRQIPKAFQIKNRYKIAIYPFKDKYEELGFVQRLFSSDTDTTTQGFFQYFFIKTIVDRKRFQIIARKRLKKILLKHKMNIRNIKTAFTDLPGSVPVRATLLWNVLKTNEGIEIAARLVDNKTRKIMTIDIFSVSEEHEALETKAKELAEKFHKEFSLLKDKIFKNSEKHFFIHPEEQEKTRMGWPVIFYREGEQKRNPVTGESLGCDTHIIGYGVVNQVGKVGVGAKIGDGNGVGVGDWIMTE